MNRAKPRTKTLSFGRSILYGWLVVGTLDGMDAMIVSIVRGSNPARMWRGVASGLLGPAAATGGLPVSFLGVCIHFFIALCVVTVFHLVSRRFKVLAQYPFIFGPIYGLLVYLFMYRVVMPLSAIGAVGRFVWPRSINDLAIHAFGVGLPSAWFASRSVGAGARDEDLARSGGGRRAPTLA